MIYFLSKKRCSSFQVGLAFSDVEPPRWMSFHGCLASTFRQVAHQRLVQNKWYPGGQPVTAIEGEDEVLNVWMTFLSRGGWESSEFFWGRMSSNAFRIGIFGWDFVGVGWWFCFWGGTLFLGWFCARGSMTLWSPNISRAPNSERLHLPNHWKSQEFFCWF